MASNVITSTQLINARNYYTKYCKNLNVPCIPSELIHFITSISALMIYTYPTLTATGEYLVGQLSVYNYNKYLGAIVSLRNCIMHPVDPNKLCLAYKLYMSYRNDPNRLDGVDDHICDYVAILEHEDAGLLGSFLVQLFDYNVGLISYSTLNLDIKVPRGRKHKYPEFVVNYVRDKAPTPYASLELDKFCVVMRAQLKEAEDLYNKGLLNNSIN